ncbi:MAG TPA: F0F1 ATP synthase subunit B [Armatimonadota bacterium]|jgi:F-type H+-transporting ATPase subunit b
MELLKQLGIDPTVIAASIMGFVLLWIFLAKFLFKPVIGVLKTREEDIRSTYEAADGEKAKANEFRAEYEKRLAGIEAEARTRIQSAVKDAEDAKNQILAEARERSEDILRRGQEDLVREREKTLAQIREEVVDLTVSAAGKLIGESLDDAKHRKLVTDFIDRIGTSK